MKRIMAILAVCGLAGAALALNIPTPPGGRDAGAKAPSAQPAAERLIVHEWGTFTGFAGSDGVHLPFGTSIGSDLPPFVVSRRTQATRDNPKAMWFDFGKGGGVFALQRMETPVIYFYTPEPREVSVAVDFPQGLLTEFYPPVREMLPAFGDAPGEPRITAEGTAPATQPAPRMTKFARGSLDWGTVRITPQVAGKRPAHMPEVPLTVAAAAHYEYARETDAATVQFSDRPGELHEERFLFYRGLGDFTLPVTLTAAAGEQFELNNASEQPIRFALLLRAANGRARFAVYRDITAARQMTLPAETVALDQAGDEIARALVAEGLHEKEARAMVKTWSANWLAEAGTRVLYTVPRAITDDLLPLRISPTPDETVRVLVGRIDVITPEEETKIQSLLATSTGAKTLAADDAAYLRSLGRFYDPAIARAAKLRGSADANAEISALRRLYVNAPRAAQAAAPAATAQ